MSCQNCEKISKKKPRQGVVRLRKRIKKMSRRLIIAGERSGKKAGKRKRSALEKTDAPTMLNAGKKTTQTPPKTPGKRPAVLVPGKVS